MIDIKRAVIYAELMQKLTELQNAATVAFKAGDRDAEVSIDKEIETVKSEIALVRPRANRKLTDEDWKKIETEGPTGLSPLSWGGFWEMRKSDTGPQRYNFACSWAQSFEDAKRQCMQGRPGADTYFLLYRNEDSRGRSPSPYTFWSERKKLKHFYVFGMIDGADGAFFRFPKLIDLYNAKDYALKMLDQEHRR